MNHLKSVFVFMPFFLTAAISLAQEKKDPTAWTYEVKRKSATDYLLIFHLSLKQGWFIWALQPGGDGTLVMPAFTFDKNDKVKMKGAVVEKGKKTSKDMDGIKGRVNYYIGKVDYVQEVIVSGKTKITGKHEYQVCDEGYALPPKYKDFVFEIK